MSPDEKKPLASVIILTWNSEPFIDLCLESLSNQTYPNKEIIIVDNASSDGTLGRLEASPFRQIVTKVITNEKNLGCAGGNNIGWRASTGEMVVILNPDTVVAKTWLEALVQALETDRRAAIAGCKIYYPNSHIIQHAGGILYPNGMTTHYGNGEEDRGQYDELRDVDYVTGASLAVRRDFLESIGGFDEDYFPAYYEETDICYKAHRRGYKVLYVPQAVLYHYESPGLNKTSPQFHKTYYKMRMRFLFKNYSLWKLLTRSLPFEIRWMLCEPDARGFRLMQLRALAQGLWFLITRRR